MRAPPESLIWMNGAPVDIARSCTLQIFWALTSPTEPPNTVKSWLATHTRRASIVPNPVTTPSPGGRLRSIPKSWLRWTANGSVSWNEPGSSSRSSRSRAVSLPFSCCLRTASFRVLSSKAAFRLRSCSMRSSIVRTDGSAGGRSSVVAMGMESIRRCERDRSSTIVGLTAVLDVHAAAGAPVLAPVSGEEALVDEIPSKRRMVVVEATDDDVHGPLVVVDPRFELERDPFEDDPALRLLRRDLGQTTVAEERSEDELFLLVHRAEGQAALSWRADLFGRPPERRWGEPVRRAIVGESNHTGCREPIQVLSQPRHGDAELIGQRRSGRLASRERSGDRQALGIGESAKDLVRRLGHVGGYSYHRPDVPDRHDDLDTVGRTFDRHDAVAAPDVRRAHPGRADRCAGRRCDRSCPRSTPRRRSGIARCGCPTRQGWPERSRAVSGSVRRRACGRTRTVRVLRTLRRRSSGARGRGARGRGP